MRNISKVKKRRTLASLLIFSMISSLTFTALADDINVDDYHEEGAYENLNRVYYANYKVTGKIYYEEDGKTIYFNNSEEGLDSGIIPSQASDWGATPSQGSEPYRKQLKDWLYENGVAGNIEEEYLDSKIDTDWEANTETTTSYYTLCANVTIPKDDGTYIFNANVEDATLDFNVGAEPIFTGKVSETDKDKYSIFYERWDLIDDNGNPVETCYSPDFSTNEEYTPLTSFKEGKTYRYSIALSKDYYSDFKFANSINLTVNGNKVILPCDENYAQETAIKTMTPKSDLTSIDDKDIVMTEDDNSNVSLDCSPWFSGKISSDKYELTDEFWISDDNKECHSKNYSAFTFEAGHNYSYGIKLSAKYGYYFSDIPRKLLINGKEIQNANFNITSDGQILTITNIKNISFGKPTADKVIDTIELKNLSTRLEPSTVGTIPILVTNLVDNDKFEIWSSILEKGNKSICDGLSVNAMLSSAGNLLTSIEKDTIYTYTVEMMLSQDAINKGYRLSDNINLKLNGKVIASSNSKKIFDNEKFNKKIEFNNVEITLSESNIEPSKEDTDKPDTPGTVTPPAQDTDKTDTPSTVTPPAQDTDKPNTPGTVTPPTQDTNKPTKDNDGKGNPTSDATSIIGIFTMFTGLIGAATFKRKK